jgi:hypothetical protein
MGFEPERSRSAGGIEPKLLPPRRFIAVTVSLAMVSPRHKRPTLSARARRPAAELKHDNFTPAAKSIAN